MMRKVRRVLRLSVVVSVVVLLAGAVHTLVVADEVEDSIVYLPAIYRVPAPGFCATRPVLLAPENGATLDTLIPLYRWTNTNDPAATIVVQEVATDPSFVNVVSAFSTGLSEGEAELRNVYQNLEPATTYYWRMALHCDDGEWPWVEGPWSETWSFTTGSGGTILPAPSLISPADGSTVAVAAFSWQPLLGAVEYILTIRPENGGDMYFHVTEPSFQWLYADLGKSYTWTVAARNDYALGTPSVERTFTVAGD